MEGQIKKTPAVLVVLAWLFVGLPWNLGSYAALEECTETISITSGSYYNSGAGDCDSACPA